MSEAMQLAAELNQTFNPPLNKLRGVGRDTAELLANAGMKNLTDLLFWLPDHYVDPAHLLSIGQLPRKNYPQALQIIGQVSYAGESFRQSNQERWFELHMGEIGRPVLKAIWNNYDIAQLQLSIRVGGWLILSGEITETANQPLIMSNPHWITLGRDYPWPIDKMSCLSYPAMAGITPLKLRKLIQRLTAYHAQLLDKLPGVQELTTLKLPTPSRALHALHLDWPCELLHALNQKLSPAHQTIHWLQQNAMF